MSPLKTLTAAAIQIFGEEIGPRKAEWLRQQLVAQKIPGRKVGRKWLLAPEDIDAALEIWLRAPRDQSTSAFGLTPTSRARRAS